MYGRCVGGVLFVVVTIMSLRIILMFSFLRIQLHINVRTYKYI